MVSHSFMTFLMEIEDMNTSTNIVHNDFRITTPGGSSVSNTESILKSFFTNHLLNPYVDSKLTAVLTTSEPDLGVRFFEEQRGVDGVYLYGYMNYGHTGTRQKVVEFSSMTTTHIINERETVLESFYFIFFIPYNRSEAIVALHRISNRSTKTILGNSLGMFIKTFNPQYRLRFRGLSSEQQFRHVMQQSVMKGISLVKRRQSRDVNDHIRHNEGNHIIVYKSKEVKLKIGEGQGSQLKDFFTNIYLSRRAGNDYIAYGNEEFENIKVKVNINGKSRTIDLSGFDEQVFAVDVTEDVTDTDQSVHEIALREKGRELLDDLGEFLGLYN